MQRLSQFEAVIFDMDGLLVDSEIIWHEVETAFFADRGVIYTHDARQLGVGLRVDDFMGVLRDHFKLDEPVRAMIDDLNGRMERTLVERVQPHAGARRLVEFLHERGVPMAVASNSSNAIIRVTMDAMGWSGILRVQCSGDDEKAGKPAPDVFLTAARKLGVDPRTCLGLEDSPRGAQAVVAAGMTCGAVPDLSHTSPAVFAEITPHVFASLNDVCDWLQEELE